MNTKRIEADPILEEAAAFYGHLGPVLMIRLRMGLIGLRELRVNDDNLRTQSMTIFRAHIHKTPFSCTIDGIQVTTDCTTGDGKLKIIDKLEIICAVFEVNYKREVTVKLNNSKNEDLKRELAKDHDFYKNFQLAMENAAMAEEKPFQ